MSIINDSHAIGVDTRNLVLKTRGTLHVKVGDRYYEIDFRNLAGSNEEEKEKEKEEYIVSVDSKDEVDKLEFPGNNKLIIGLDGSLFVTKNNTIIDVTPKQSVIEKESTINIDVTNIKSASVSGKLYSDEGYLFDFANGELVVRTLSVDEEINIPHDTIKNRCCRTYIEKINVDGEEIDRVVRNYVDYDFIELVDIPDFMIVKSGAIVKATNSATLFVCISEAEREFTFEVNGLYIIYKQGNEIIITKLN
jgi:hypothetical protein